MLVDYYTIIGGDERYIGSTINGIDERWRKHKSDTNPCASKYLFEKYGIENCRIEKIETYDCATAKERYKREGDLVRATPNCVNKYVPGRSFEEYCKELKEEITTKRMDQKTPLLKLPSFNNKSLMKEDSFIQR